MEIKGYCDSRRGEFLNNFNRAKKEKKEERRIKGKV